MAMELKLHSDSSNNISLSQDEESVVWDAICFQNECEVSVHIFWAHMKYQFISLIFCNLLDFGHLYLGISLHLI